MTIGPLRQVKVRVVAKIDHLRLLTYAAYNLVRMRSLMGRAMTLRSWCVSNPSKGRAGAQKRPENGLREAHFGPQAGEMTIFILSPSMKWPVFMTIATACYKPHRADGMASTRIVTMVHRRPLHVL